MNEVHQCLVSRENELRRDKRIASLMEIVKEDGKWIANYLPPRGPETTKIEIIYCSYCGELLEKNSRLV